MNNSEIDRIIRTYKKRDESIDIQEKYSLFDLGNLFIIHSRDRHIIRALKKNGISSLSEIKILDIGCGTGGELINLVRCGASPNLLYGIDLLKQRIEIAKKRHPGINFICGNAEMLPFPDSYFDIVMQFTVFTSILDVDIKMKIAREMLRVLKSDGLITWYDYFIKDPKNPDVNSIKNREIHNLFPLSDIQINKITLAPPLARRIACRSFFIGCVLESLKIFNTHYLAMIKKRNKSAMRNK